MAQYLSYDGLRKYDELLKAWHDKDHQALEDKIAALVGGDSDLDITLAELSDNIDALAAKHDLDVESLRDLVAEITGANSDSIASMGEMNAKIESLQGAVDALNGTGEDSVEAKAEAAANDAVAALVGGAPEAFDTLKEIADWIDQAGNSEVFELAGNVAEAKNAADAAQAAADAAQADANQNASDIALASNAIASANDRLDAIEALLGSDGSDSEGESVVARVDSLEAAHAADIAEINGKIDAIRQEEDAAIPEADIISLFHVE